VVGTVIVLALGGRSRMVEGIDLELSFLPLHPLKLIIG
jgi:hypothetical protein